MISKKYRKSFAISILLMALLVGINNPKAMVYLKNNDSVCTETDEHKKWSSLSDYEKEKTIEPVKCEETIEAGSIVKKINYSKAIENVDYKTLTKFDLRNVNGHSYVTSVKNQIMSNGTDSNLCWAFATASVVESAYIVGGGEVTDLSERHIGFNVTSTLDDNTSNPYGYYHHKMTNGVDDGGNYLMSGAYLAQNRGPVLDSRVPLSTINSNHNNTLDIKANFTVQNSHYAFAKSCQDDNAIDNIKYLLTTYGAVASYMNSNTEYLSDDKSSFYYAGDDAPGHAVTIIGWDDSYSKNNFKASNGSIPAQDGAWIVKNTYTDLMQISDSEKGYHYISYYDKDICANVFSVSNVTKNSYENKYLYDNLGWSGDVITLNSGNNVIYYKEIYNKNTDNAEIIKNVNLFGQPGDQFEVYYSETDKFSDAIKIASGEFTTLGYQSVNISSPNIITSSKFYLFTKYISNEKTSSNGKDAYTFPVYLKPTISLNNPFYTENIKGSVAYYNADSTKLESPSQWIDTTSNSLLKFYPVVHLFTNNIDYNLSTKTPIPSNQIVTTEDGGYYYIPLSISNVNLSDINVKIYNSSNVDSTNLFSVEQYMEGYKIEIKPGTTIGGTYKVSFTYKDITVSENISIIDGKFVPIEKINISGLNEVSVNGTLELNAIIIPSNASITTINWSSSDESVAIVNENGIVMGRKAGKVTITASSTDNSGILGKYDVNVIDINMEEGNGVTKPLNLNSTSSESSESTTKNPKTGIYTFYKMLIITIIVGVLTYILIKKKNKFPQI